MGVMIDSPYETSTPMPWMAHDAPEVPCASLDPEAFFPEEGHGRSPEVRMAQQVCSTCPLQAECLEWSQTEVVLYGTWGGVGKKARYELRRGRVA